MKKHITRREALVGIGGAVTVGCGSSGSSPPDAAPDGTNMPPADTGTMADASAPEDSGPPPTSTELLAGIESVIVLMMENRSLDHFLGSLKTDTTYTQKAVVDGLTGTETNPDPNNMPVQVFKMSNFTPADPPHGWNPCHAQWNMGKNDGFVKAHAGASQNEVMGYHDRSQLPFYYWLADNFCLCDNWFSSVMGPTWPNRFYLHACSSGGKKDNTPFITGGPTTLWSRLKDEGKTFKNYRAGIVAWYTGGFVGQMFSINPVAPIAEFFADAKNGTLPNFAIIDPDFQGADDHPSHDILKGQVFVASLYKALAESPQWNKTLFVIVYDEHGGFYDHVPPPTTKDDLAEFQQLGFRVPAFVIGGMVKKGYVNKTVFEHSSVGSTLKARYAIKTLNQRMDAAADLSSCIDPITFKNPTAPPQGMPMPMMEWKDALDKVGPWSQPELAAMIESGAIPHHQVDSRTAQQITLEWLGHADRLGAVKMR